MINQYIGICAIWPGRNQKKGSSHRRRDFFLVISLEIQGMGGSFRCQGWLFFPRKSFLPPQKKTLGLLMATRNPANPNQLRLVVEIPLSTRVLAPSQVLQDFFHQQDHWEKKTLGERFLGLFGGSNQPWMKHSFHVFFGLWIYFAREIVGSFFWWSNLDEEHFMDMCSCFGFSIWISVKSPDMKGVLPFSKGITLKL